MLNQKSVQSLRLNHKLFQAKIKKIINQLKKDKATICIIMLLDNFLDRNMREVGKITKNLGLELCIMRMVISMKENGQMIKCKDLVFSILFKEMSIKDNGKITKNMGKAYYYLKMETNMMANGNMMRCKEQENLFTRIKIYTKGCFTKVLSMVLGYTFMKMEINMKVNGNMERRMGKEYFGGTVVNGKVTDMKELGKKV